MEASVVQSRSRGAGVVRTLATERGQRRGTRQGMGTGGVLFLLLLMFFLWIPAVAVVEGIPYLAGFELGAPWEDALEYGIVFGVLAWVGKRRWGGTWRDVYPLRSFPWRSVAPIALVGVGMAVLLSEVASWIPMPAWFAELMQEEFGNAAHPARALAFVVLAPVLEELFFRGYILREMLRRYSVRTAVVASSAAFALFHLNPWQAVLAFPMGLFAAWLFLRTRSLLPCILLHAAINGLYLPVLLALRLAGVSLEEIEAAEAMESSPLWMLGIAALFVAGGLVWSRRALRSPAAA